MSTDKWGKADARSEEAAQGMFLRLKEHKDKAIGAFIGDPEVREVVWNVRTNQYDVLTDEMIKSGVKSKPRFIINFFIPTTPSEKKGEKDHPAKMVVFEMSNDTYKDLRKNKDKYGLEQNFFEIERDGKKGDTETTYTITPEKNAKGGRTWTAQDDKDLAALTPHDLLKIVAGDFKDEPGAATDMNSHANANAKGHANGSANGSASSAPEPEIDKGTKDAIQDRLKVRPMSEISEFLIKFGAAKVKNIKASDAARAFAELDKLDGGPKKAAPPATAEPVNPFED